MESKTNVLIFPCGSGIGLEICQSLYQLRNFNIIGSSSIGSEPNPAIGWLDKYYGNLPLLVNENELVNDIQEIIEIEKINFIFPGYDDAIIFFTKNSNKLGNATVLSVSYNISNICRSKSLTYNYFQNDIRVPKIYTLDNLKFPVFVKPDKGQGSHGAKKIDNINSLLEHNNTIIDPLILEYLPYQEYTVDCFSDREKGLLFIGIRERIRVVNGICVATKNVDIPDAKIMATKIQNKLSMHGAWFFQVKYATDNSLCLLEIAPRISGCMAFYRGIGINFAALSIYEALRKPIEIIMNKIPENLHMVKIYRNYYPNKINYKIVYIDLDDTLIQNNLVNSQLIQFIYQCFNNNIKCYLITRCKSNPYTILRKYHICAELFENIIHISNNKSKSEFIIEPKISLFIDDSFSERKEVYKTGAFVIDCSSLDLVLNISDKNNNSSDIKNSDIWLRDVIKDPRTSGVNISYLDKEIYFYLRKNVSFFLANSAKIYSQNPGILLDIAPQIHEGAKAYFINNIEIKTLDICPDSNPTYLADITINNEKIIPSDYFHYIVCTEVLEHTIQPFKAIDEIYRISKSGAYLFLSIPCNFRIHGPLPDCWRFTEHGIKELLANRFNIIEFNALELPERPLFPIQYTIVAQKI
jgi:carbamoyl-phosphate synthase large subunit